MSDTPYEKECMYCKNKIMMSMESGKWLPYNLNNGPHDCRTKQETTTQNNNKQVIEKFDYNDLAVLDKLLKIVKHAVEHDSKGFNKQ